MDYPITIQKTRQPAAKPEPGSDLGFGRIFADHQFMMDYRLDQGWHQPRIVPYAAMDVDPATICLHYGQAVFDGLKAYRTPKGSINLFRPLLHFQRLNQSARRMVIPEINPDFCLMGLKTLLKLERDWIPHDPGCTLYIRPLIMAMDTSLIVQPAHHYRLMIILSPSGAYYPQGIRPIDIFVETDYVRAVRGGSGESKTPGNYAASLIAQKRAKDAGCVQALWLDGIHHQFIEEIGAMNVFFVIDGKIVTPALQGSILPGITRRTVLELSRQLGYETEERPVALAEICEKTRQGRVSEAFGTGTAAVISPIGSLLIKNEKLVFNHGQTGPLTQMFYDQITGIQFGRIKDPAGWVTPLD